MNKKSIFLSLIIIIILSGISYFIYSYNNKLDKWVLEIPEAGTNSSPKVIDLNRDGILDIVLGAGGKEYESSAYAVIAINGKNGELLWKKEGRNQIVGSAVFKDITGDGVEDIFIGGRSAQLFALDGTNGKLIWEYLPSYPQIDLENDTTLLNFFNPQFIPDQDNDGVEDLLIAFGGFVKALPDEKERPQGYLMAISTKTGEVLTKAAMPDGKETYMSPVLLDQNRNLMIVFGSGGETINGGLFVIPLTTFMNEGLVNAKQLADGNGKGFIAPPTLADITGDGQLDIVCNAVKGKMHAYDGKDFQKIWEVDFGETLETYSMPAPFTYNEDNITDFFVSYGIGTWPNIDRAIQMVIDGKNGNITFTDTLGSFQFASPIVYDLMENGTDNILFAINMNVGTEYIVKYNNLMVVYDFLEGGKYFQLGKSFDGTNLGSTPLITDLDNDGFADIIYCNNGTTSDFFGYRDLKIERIESKVPYTKPKWSEYMGEKSKAIYIKGNKAPIP